MDLFHIPSRSLRVDKIEKEDWYWLDDSWESRQRVLKADKTGKHFYLGWEYCHCCGEVKMGRKEGLSMALVRALERLSVLTRQYHTRENPLISRAHGHPFPFIHRDAWAPYDYTRRDTPSMTDLWPQASLDAQGVASLNSYLYMSGLIVPATPELMWVNPGCPTLGRWAITYRGLQFMNANTQLALPVNSIVSSNNSRQPQLRAWSKQTATLPQLMEHWQQSKAKDGRAELATAMLAWGLQDMSDYLGDWANDRATY
jgi:hypothetical protein